MKRYVLIVAGGLGRRMGQATPKQFLLLNGRPILIHTIERMAGIVGDADITVVLPGEFLSLWQKLVGSHGFSVKHSVAEGGEERFHSVRKGLLSFSGEGLVAIHDGVRPLVSAETVLNCFDEAAKTGAAIPAVAPAESVRMVTTRGSMPVSRDAIRLVQTPQVFRLDLIKKAYEIDYNAHYTDDATVAEQAGIPVSVVEGNRENIKITTPADMIYAETLLSKGIQ